MCVCCLYGGQSDISQRTDRITVSCRCVVIQAAIVEMQSTETNIIRSNNYKSLFVPFTILKTDENHLKILQLPPSIVLLFTLCRPP